MEKKKMKFCFSTYQLVLALMYAFILGIAYNIINDRIKSGSDYTGWILYAICFFALLILIMKSRVKIQNESEGDSASY